MGISQPSAVYSLAVVSSVSIDDTFPLTIVSLCACCLGAVSLFFCLLSADRIITIASTVSSDAIHDKQSLRESFRSFFCSSVMKYFLGNALLLSMSNLLMASMSLITENYFGLSATHLWIGALGFPIGGMISVARRTTIPKDQRNSKTSVLSGSTKLFILVAICLGATPYAPPQTETVAKSMLFFFGLVTGMVYSVTFASSIELWLLKLNEFGVSFVSRATVINNFGAQAMIATIFQIQTVAVDNIADTSSENGISWTETLVYFAPHMILSLIVIALYYTIPNPPNCHSMWPRAPIQLWGRLTIRTLKLIPGMSSVSKSLLFSGFQQNRMAIMMENKDNMSIESGSIIPEKSELSPAGLESYLQCFDLLQTRDTWWRAPEAVLSDILLDNQTALERRLHLIGEATQSIAILTWVFEDSTAGQRIADALIERANAGIDVKVIVDGVTVQYLKEEKQLLGTKKLGMLEYLVKNGVQVGSLESWVEELDSRFVVGTHRKVMIVDARYVRHS
jgi:PLD-like domain